MWKDPCDADRRRRCHHGGGPCHLHLWRLEGSAVAVPAEAAPAVEGAALCRAGELLTALNTECMREGWHCRSATRTPSEVRGMLALGKAWTSWTASVQLLSHSRKDYFLFHCAVRVNAVLLLRKQTTAFPYVSLGLLQLGEECVSVCACLCSLLWFASA